jgi:S-(hydroxymethyl)glutathione dehydrogenase/alcohol dehydrogenase
MRGIVYTGEKIDVTSGLEVRAPGPTEVKVRIAAAGVCHSDISVINGTIPFPTPVVLGHEGAGVVEEVGAAVRKVKVGDHVVLTTLASCGQCTFCSSGHPTWCRSSIGMPTQPFTYEGQPAWNFASASVFADMTVVAENQAVPIDKDVPLTSACLIGCGVITGAGAVLNRAKPAPGATAAVFGIGGIGLNVIQALRIAAAGRIIAIDTVASKESLARQFGATDWINAADTDAVAAVRELLPGNGIMASGGVDWSFECVGHPAVLANAIDVLDWGGNCVIIGVPPPDAKIDGLIGRFTHIDRGLLGCRYGSAQPHHDIPLFIDLYKRGLLKLDELVSATYPMEDFTSVVADMHEGKLARGVLTF